ncbi:MAG TPA: hypothetical protein VM513_27080 [Kofleriaceae bacterium]|nr:hypothetical protein [Kofleriaceae bacterium]
MSLRGLILSVPLLVGLGCGAHKPPTSDRGPQVAVARESGDALRQQRIAAHTTYAVNATSLAPGVDTAVVERMVRQRLGQAASLALRDVLDHTRNATDSRALQDVMLAIQGLVVEISDAETRSQNLIAALLRTGVATLVVEWIQDQHLDTLGCAAEQLPNAVYEALAQSTYLRPLGFTAARGSVSSSCGAFAGRMALAVDTIAVIGTDLAVIEDAYHSAVAAGLACNTDSVRGVIPIDLRLAFKRAAATGPAREIAALRELRIAFARSRQTLAATNPPALEPFEACFASLEQYTRQLEKLDPILGDWSAIGTLPVSALEQNIATVQSWLPEKARSSDGLSRIRSLLTTMVQGRPLRRADFLPLLASISQAAREAWGQSFGGRLVGAVLDAAPQAFREDAAVATGVRIDVPQLATMLTTQFSEHQRTGAYLRATIGVGYAVLGGDGTETTAASTLHEEIGVGYRWGDSKLLAGPHIMASGLLFRATAPDGLDDAVIVAGGVSANLYRVIDLSANVGRALRSGDDAWIGMISLQLPLTDYFAALTAGGTTSEKK